MRIALTQYGWPQVVVYPAIIICAMALCLAMGMFFWPLWAIIAAEAILGIILIWVLSFFRDPFRLCPVEKKLLLSPADGTITDVEIVQENNFIAGQALKIGIFLSIFNAHINRSPCNASVEKVVYKKGKFKNAMNPQSSQVNESNDLWLTRTDEPKDKIIVRQISGAIARRIVCNTAAGRILSAGENFGMIKFGSGTELYLPANKNAKCLVKKGDKVKAGLTALVRYEKCQD